MVEKIISLIAPHHCIECGILGDLICQACLLTSIISPPSRCIMCHKSTSQSKLCQACRPKSGLDHVWVAAYYQDSPKQLIYSLKFSRAKAGALPIARSIDNILPDIPKKTLVTHLPTANKRLRLRGYDQSALIAKSLAKTRGLKYKQLLLRKGISRQVGASRKERFIQLESSITPIYKKTIKNAHVLVVDDVITTGASLEAAAKTLKSAGAKTVDAVVFAQAID